MKKYDDYLDSLYNHFTPDCPDPINKYEQAVEYFRKEMLTIKTDSIVMTLSANSTGERCRVQIIAGEYGFPLVQYLLDQFGYTRIGD